jgi:hypothetical protein
MGNMGGSNGNVGGGSGDEIQMSGYITLSGSTPTIAKSKNVSSLTYRAAGNYTAIPVNNLPSVNYVLAGTSSLGKYVCDGNEVLARAVDGVPLEVRTAAGAFNDTTFSFEVTGA